MKSEQRIRQHLSFLYGEKEAGSVWAELEAHLSTFRRQNPHLHRQADSSSDRLTQRDVFLITYGDQVSEAGRSPLQCLTEFLSTYLRGAISTVHLLPFYPYSSDDGFSVIDYREVDPALGSWQDIARIAGDFGLMFDAVINHTSRQSTWFQGFLRRHDPYRDYFIVVDPAADLSEVVRPRDRPLLTTVETAAGPQHVWTTFSDDQIDLNYANPQVLLEIIDLLLFYAERGAGVIRLDAIAYLWKEIGTRCIHLPQTHHVVQLFRAVLDAAAPGVLLITETNVPHGENVSYFGDGTDEAQLVYQFPLAPLVLHTMHTGSARLLANWVGTLATPSSSTTFFNFVASHDGIGLMPARGLLKAQEVEALIRRTIAHGGQVSYKANSDASRDVYELNITLFDALNDPRSPDPEADVNRFLASQAIMLSLAGVPGIYFHSLLGSRNCRTCVQRTGRARSINREKLARAALERQLIDHTSRQHQVFQGYLRLLQQRRTHPAFHPNGGQRVLALPESLFALVRTAPQGEEVVLCLINVTPRQQRVCSGPTTWELPTGEWIDLIGGRRYVFGQAGLELILDGYQVMWLLATGTRRLPNT